MATKPMYAVQIFGSNKSWGNPTWITVSRRATKASAEAELKFLGKHGNKDIRIIKI